MSKIDFIVGTFLIIWVGVVGYELGHTEANNEPTNDYVYFDDYKSSYRLHKDTQYRVEQIEDISGVYYYVYLFHEGNYMVVEYEDTLIDGEFTFAKHWAQSFIANFGGLE